MKQETTGVPVIGVGASAGGLEALRSMFAGFNGEPGMAFVVIQHLDPNHDSLMAQLIERYTAMPVAQVTGGETVEPNQVYVIPPGHGLAIYEGVLHLTDFSAARGLRRPIDDFFESLAEDRGGRAACVILSGTGGDGSRGLRAIKERGGLCIAQEPTSAAYDGMPGSAMATGLVDLVCPPGEIIGKLSQFFGRGKLSASLIENGEMVADHIDELCNVLRDAVGHDFSNYKRTTLSRRIARRMQVLGIDSGPEYLARLRADSSECAALFRDLLINVTRFFRDPIQFEALRDKAIDAIVRGARDAQEIRVWVPGCSSGEEAYTLAMLFADAAQRHGKRPFFQIFATDIDDKMIDVARTAVYPLALLQDIPQPYRDRYVVGGADTFTIANQIRDMVRFSLHNVVRDPPFSKVDLVSCRNLLIYFDDALQRKVLPLFHFSLREEGYLFLGTSETVGRHDDLFEVVDLGSRLFQRKTVQGRYSLPIAGPGMFSPRRTVIGHEQVAPPLQATTVDALKLIAERYSPVALLVDRDGMLLEKWGAAGRYLQFPDRTLSRIHVPSLALPGIREALDGLIRKVSATNRPAGVRELEITTSYGTIPARIVCEPVRENSFLIVIEETGQLRLPADDEIDVLDIEAGQHRFLEEELSATRHRLSSTVEELETANEELKSSNEEMMSMNEELQSTNEELTTVNDELKSKIDQVVSANSDLRNFFDSTQLCVLMVDNGLRLRNFTNAALSLFAISKDHIGDSLTELPTELADRSFLALVRECIGSGRVQEKRVTCAADQRDFVLRVFPYIRNDGTTEGATLVFNDVTKSLLLERDLAEEQERLRLALEVAKIGVWEYEPETDRTVLDETERRLLNLSSSEDGTLLEPILANLPSEDRDRVNLSLRQAMDGKRVFDEIFRVPLGNGEYRWLHGLGKRIEMGGVRKFIGVTFDISSERALLDQRELMIREMNHRVKNLFSVIGAMVSIAARETSDVEAFATSLRERIHALGRSHSLTNRVSDGMTDGIALSDLVDTVVRPHLAGQTMQAAGDPLQITNAQITSLALILHEWATNSAKYGAMSVPDGELSVTWSDRDGTIVIDWIEVASVHTATDARPGFGTRLVETAARQLQGTATGAPQADGYTRCLSFPAPAVAAPSVSQ